MNRFPKLLVMSTMAAATAFAQPLPQSSEYLKTTGGGAQIERKGGVSSVYFALLLEWNKTPPPDAYVVAAFENTENAAAPYLVEKPVAELDAKPVLRSPIYPCVRNNNRYDISVKIYSDSSKKNLLGTHDQQLAFGIPTKMLRELNLKECGA